MKKLSYLVLTLAVFGALSFTSCKKECTCVYSVDGEEISRTTMEVKGKCSDSNSTTTTMGSTIEVKCK